jgi:hypothetical protein
MDRVHGFGSWVNGILVHSRSLILWSTARIFLKQKRIGNLILALHLRADDSHRSSAVAPWGGGSPKLRSWALWGTSTRGFWGKMTRGSTESLPGMKRGGEQLQGGSRWRLPTSEHGQQWAVAPALFWLQQVAQRLSRGLLLLLPTTDWLERQWGSGAWRTARVWFLQIKI